jgi:type III restriction enzyme
LRSSGSENSKLQEVGRGLRLPVDENGNRISNEEFKLNYIVDFTDADFATKLINQINNELPSVATLDRDKFAEVAKKRNIDPDDLFIDLLSNRFIDRDYNIKSENRDKFFVEYPEFIAGLSSGKVTDKNVKKSKPVKIRKAVYNEIKEL